MTPDQIKSLIKEKGGSQNRVARRLRISQTSLSFFVNGKLKSDKIGQRLARFLGVKKEDFEQVSQ